ncbi:MAG TPA: hypothetical protein VD862_01600 [Candidatus Paceibacterota bacterium]|nr:hypothetical protein [Candidatus Paceibacterota bacterium]
MKNKKKLTVKLKPLKPRNRMKLKAGQVFLDRRLKRAHTRSQQKAKFRKELTEAE